MRTLEQMTRGHRRAVEKGTPDMVNSPPHYTKGGVECIDALEAMLGKESFIDHCRATTVKYLWRAPYKGAMVQDLEKAEWYLRRALEAARGEAPVERKDEE